MVAGSSRPGSQRGNSSLCTCLSFLLFPWGQSHWHQPREEQRKTSTSLFPTQPSTPQPVGPTPTCVTLRRVQGQPAVLLSATQCTVTMSVTIGRVSVGQNSCDRGPSQSHSGGFPSSLPTPGHRPRHERPQPCPNTEASPHHRLSAPLTFSQVSGGHRETSTWAPCSHTSSQNSWGPAGPVSTTWSWPEGPPCGAHDIGSQGLRALPVHHSSREPPETPAPAQEAQMTREGKG